MRRFVWYEIKAMMRYSSGVRRRRLSLLTMLFAPVVLVFNIRLIVHYGLLTQIKELFDRYNLLTLILVLNVLVGGGLSISIGRVSSKAAELVFSSGIRNSELFAAFYAVVLFNVLPIIVPEIYLAYLLLPPEGSLLYTALLILSTLIGYSFMSSAKGYKETLKVIAPVALIALSIYVRPASVEPLEDVYVLKFSTYGLLELLSFIIIALAAIPYGVEHARELLLWKEGTIKAGKLGKGPIGVLKIHLIRSPSLLFFLVLSGVIVLLNAMSYEGQVLLMISSTAVSIAIIASLILIYTLSRELGRRDLRLASANDRLPFRVRLYFSLISSLIYSIGSAIVAFLYEPMLSIRAFLWSFASVIFPFSVASYYASGACRPAKGSLRDAFRAPIAKQVFVLMLITAGVYMIALPLLAISYDRGLDLIVAFGLIALAYPIIRASERRFLSRARKLR